MLTATPSSVLLFRDGAVVDVSEEACRELARARAELLGDRFGASLLPDDRAALDGWIHELESGRDDAGPPVPLTARRSRVGVTVDVLEIRLASAEGGGVLADVRDVTERDRLDRVMCKLATSTHTVDAEANILWLSEATAAALGITREEFVGVNNLEVIHPDDLPKMLSEYADLLDHPGETRVGFYRVRLIQLDNTWVTTRVTGVNCIDDPLIGGIIVRSEQQTEMDRIESIGTTRGAFRSLAERAPIGIIVTDRTGRASYYNTLARDFFGLQNEAHVGGDWKTHVRPENRDALDELLHNALQHQTPGSTLVTLDLAEGRTVWLRVDVHAQLDEHDQPYGLIATLQDVTAETLARQELLDAQDRLWQLANHDLVTGLPNRAFLTDRLERALARQQRSGTPLTLLCCDLDGFKAVNDTLGHLAGDAVLVEAGLRLGSAVRDTDTVSRFGGDEFLVICEGLSNRAEIGEVAARIVSAIAAPMTIGDATVHVGCSVGVAVGEQGMSADELILRADKAMYAAKAAGKGSFHFA